MTQPHCLRLIGIVFTMVTITSCLAQVEETIRENPRIEGVWSWQPVGDCVERYEFRRDGSALLSSGEENLEGTYRLSSKPEANTKRYQLQLKIIRDNGGSDCFGGATDDTGVTITEYVEFDASGESITMCRDPIGADCFGPLRKHVEGAAGERSPSKATPSASGSDPAAIASRAHLRAQRLLYAGRIESAVSAWEEGLASFPEDFESLAALGATLYANGEPAKAAVFLELAAAKAHDDWPLRILHATTLELSGQRELARREFDAIAAESPNAMIRDTARALREGRSQFHDPTTITPEITADLRIAVVPGRTWIGVLQGFEWAKTPTEINAGIVAAASTQLLLHQWAAAEEMASVLAPGRSLASALCPHHLGGLFTVYFGQSAMVNTFSYAKHRSLTVFRAWKDSAQEGNPAALREVANVFSFMADTYRAAEHRKPEDKMLIATVMGAVRAEEGNLSEAEQFYRLALSLSGFTDNPQARTLISGVYLAMADMDAGPVENARQTKRYQKHLKKAESELEVALKRWPGYSKALLNLGIVRDLQGRSDEAIALAERAATLRPSLWEAYGNLACTYKEAGSAALAREAFERLQETAPDQSQRFLKCVEEFPPAR